MKKTVSFVFVFWCLMGAFWAGSGPVSGNNTLRFKHISHLDGLSQDSITCILQDQKGFMWFGTMDGLNRYDGYGFKIYRPEPGNPNSLSSNWIMVLYEDSTGIIWIGTNGGGLNRFDPQTETFFRYPVAADADAGDPGYLNSGFIRAIYRDSSGVLWVGTGGGGLCKLTHEPDRDNPGKVKEKFVHYTNVPGDPHSLGSDSVYAILEDREGIFWIGTFAGLKQMDRRQGTFTHFQGTGLARVTNILEDRQGTLWVTTSTRGVHSLNKKTGTFANYRSSPDDPRTLGSDIIRTIYEDRFGVIWVGTWGAGLNRLDRETGTFTRYPAADRDPSGLRGSRVSAIYEDRGRLLWVGTNDGGLNKYDRNQKFEHYRHDPANPNSLGSNKVFAICEDRSGILWIGSGDSGLDKFDHSTGIFTHYRHSSNKPGSLGSDGVFSILEDHLGVLWVGTVGGGLNRFNRETGTFTRYRNSVNDPRSLSSDNIITLYEDRSGVLWVGTLGDGLNKFNRETQTFTRYGRVEGNPGTLSDNGIDAIYESPTEPGILWIGTRNNGFNRFDIRGETATRYLPDPDAPHGLSGKIVQTIHEDRYGTLWIGTYSGGLNKMIRKKGEKSKFVPYTEKNGLPNNSIYGILEDKNGYLWLSTNKGICRFDPRTGACKNYDERDGLQGDEFNSGAYFKSRSGEMFFGGLNGFNAFYPSGVRDNPHRPPVAITAFRLFNKPVPIVTAGTKPGPVSPLEKSISRTTVLKLSYEQNVFSFEFSALDFTIPGKNNYAYKMEGFDSDWIHTDSRYRFAPYTNLGPGEYIFRVRGSNNDGVWNNEGTSIKIIITPPFWQTLWFRIILILAVLGLAALGYRLRLKNARIKTELQTARDAQMSIMPQTDPEIAGFDISGVCVPASEVGGDFFDYIWLNEEKTRLGIAVGDVSGKAMKSAMTAVMTSGMIYSKADEYKSVKEIMRRVNRPLYFKTGKKVFTALCLAALDIDTKKITFTNAGLQEPLLLSGGRVSKLKGAGNRLPLGLRQDSVYREKKQQLKPGDVVVFFTDGITETRNPRGQFYGLEAMESLLGKPGISGLSAKELKNKIIADVRLFSEGALQHDDMTVVVVRVL